MVTLNPLALALVFCAGGDTVLLDFSADWCGPCRMMDPIVRRLADEGYPVRKINIDRDPQTAARYQVSGVPCFVMLRGGQEVDRVVGAASHARLLQMFGAGGQGQGPPPREFAETRLAAADSPRSPRSELPPPHMPRLHPTSERAAAVPQEPASALPHANPQSLRDRAMQATVRLKVQDPKGHSVGTGTVIDVHGAEALILTCAHIFRDSAGKGQITVDLFADGATRSVEGQLVNYDMDRDIGFVSIVPETEIQPVCVAAGGMSIRKGSAVFSVGCDRGGAPRLLDSRLSAIDKYLGPPNFEVAGQPVDGRSGGGLFAADSGCLIGVCNMADPADNEGIYAALPAIHWALDRIGQRSLYQPNQETAALAVAPPPRREMAPPADAGPASVAQTMPTRVDPGAIPETMPAAIDAIPLLNASLSDDTTEIICIIRRQGQQRLVVLDQPSNELVDRLVSESRVPERPTEIALQPKRGTRSPADWPSRRASGGESFRAQSADR